MVFKASSQALCGPYLFELNPSIVEDFWEFDRNMPNLFKNIPRWMIPNAYRVRDKVLAEIKKWHLYSRERCDVKDEEIREVEWEPYFGSKYTRERQRLLGAIDGHDDDALVANDLAMLWAYVSLSSICEELRTDSLLERTPTSSP